MIDVEDVTVQFGDLAVLDGVDLAVEAGAFVGLVGPNGAGKTTLLRTINGVLEPDAGAVRLGGDPVAGLGQREVSRRVASVPQETHLGFAFTAEQVVEMGRTPHRSRLDWAPERDAVEAAIERTGIEGLRDRPVDRLSGGERSRVLLARALAQDAPALVLDEPTASLDINHQVGVLDLCRDLVEDGRAAIAAIHDLDLAARYCDHLALLHDGVIAAAGEPAAVLADPTLSAAFGTEAAVTENPVTGTPTVSAVGERGDRETRVHVVGSGRGAARAVGDLWAAGFEVSVGVVPAGDVVADVAAQLDLERVTTTPLSPPEEAKRRAAAALAREAAVTLRAPGSDEPGFADARSAGDGVVHLEGDVGAGTDGAPAPDAVAAVLGALEHRPALADD